MTIKETPPVEEEEKKQPWLFAKWVVGVLYSPMKTFEEIVKKPSIKGPILILLLTLPFTVGVQYTSGARFFLETPTPENDLWTEKPSDTLFLWGSNGNITFDSADYVSGNYSVSASLTNSSLVWLQLTNIGSFNCSEEEYTRLSFSIKWVQGANAVPATTLQLFSLNNESNRFELDLGDVVANSTGVWANVSVNLATDEWTQVNSPSWENITGIGFRLAWDNPSTLVVKIDGLFFGKYLLFSSLSVFGLQLVYSLMQSIFDFLLEWLILSGILWLALKSFSGWKGVWKDLVSIFGYIYSAYAVYLGVLALLFLFLPPIFLPYNVTYLEYVDVYESSWGIPISILRLLAYGWASILCTVALKKMTELSWSKAFIIGFVAVVISLLFSSLLLSVFV